MAHSSPGRRLREAVADVTIQIPGAFNALVGRMAEETGFDAIYLSGAALSAGTLALPDVGLFSLSELATHAAYLTRQVRIPVIVDADTGFGGSMNVERTVRELEAAGVAAIQLEDQELPKRCGHLSGKRLVTPAEMCAKLRAAKAARIDADLVLIARTDAASVNGFDDAIERAKQYLEAGADWIFPEALATRDEFERFAQAIDAPLLANMTEFGKSPLLSLEELADLGYAAVLYPVTLMRVAMKAVEAALATLASDGTQAELLDLMQTRQELYDLIGYEDYEARDRAFFQRHRPPSKKVMSEPIYSPGLEGVVAGETAISTITGGLEYRGYSVDDLARGATFEEVAFLLLHGELPTHDQLAALNERLHAAAHLPAPLVELLRGIPQSVPMMDVMRTGASALAHWDEEAQDNSHAANVRKAERRVAQLPLLMAARHRLVNDMEPVPIDPSLSLAGNILWMLFREMPTERMTRAMDVSLILYAEHEYNASTFTARVVASTLSDLDSGITAAIGALEGPLHGGANEQVMHVLKQVGSADKAEAWVRDALARKQRIMGFGHRVYKTGDPRAMLLKDLCGELAAETGNVDMETMADTIERIVVTEKKLPPNLDWPSARLYYYLGLDIDLYTPLFVVSRVTGWGAHVIEQLDNNRLIRPRANYIGPASRPWVPIAKR